MHPRAARLLALVPLLLAGCGGEEERIELELVNRSISYDSTYLREVTEIEMHNAPFPGLGQAETAALIKAPPSYGDGISFAAASVGTADREAVRLVAIFNGRAPVNDRDVCGLTEEMGHPEPLSKTGFTADLALCRGRNAVAVGSVKADSPVAGRDPAFVERAMSRLMTAIFGNVAERRELEQRVLPMD